MTTISSRLKSGVNIERGYRWQGHRSNLKLDNKVSVLLVTSHYQSVRQWADGH